MPYAWRGAGAAQGGIIMPERDHAVVLGGGMSGLLAARVLSESFARVTIVERDCLPESDDGRRGVPQGRHVHGLQARGVEIMDQLFPDLVAEIAAQGAPRVDDLSRGHFAPNGHLLAGATWPIAPLLFASRPFLESAVRRRVRDLPNVTVLDSTVVSSLVRDAPSDGSPASVLGVKVLTGEETTPRLLDAELVVDATGRATRTPRWLAELGYPRPEEERVTVRVRYASQQVRLPADGQPKDMVVESRRPDRAFGLLLFRVERDSWTFTLTGTDAELPPTAPEARLKVARELAPRWVSDALAEAEPLGPVATHAFPASVRRRYDRLTAFPRGLLVFGDAICSFNPIYGQGMAVAGEQALALRSALANGGDADLALRFFRAAARPVGNAWQLAVGSDMAMPGVEGSRPLAMRLSNRYVGRVLTAAETDPEVARRFLRVAGLLDPPTALFDPRIVIRVLRAAVGRSPGWAARRGLVVPVEGREPAAVLVGVHPVSGGTGSLSGSPSRTGS
jgi:2-polyprenyl-6-methoxyphenol hydroxylase-like FAD-dependent oxidoreductase